MRRTGRPKEKATAINISQYKMYEIREREMRKTDLIAPHLSEVRHTHECGGIASWLFARCTVGALHTSSSSTSLIVPCQEVIESCNKCLTDYDITVERRFTKVRDGRQKREIRYWFITINSYHRLGSGRSPYDGKWRVFMRPNYLLGPGYSRDTTRYPQGAVRDAWKESEREGF